MRTYKRLRDLQGHLQVPWGGGVAEPIVLAEIPTQSDHLLNPNPCVRTFGFHQGLGSKHCVDCKHLERGVGTQKVLAKDPSVKGMERCSDKVNVKIDLHRCPFRGETHAPHIQHELEWDACAKYEGGKAK